MHVECMIVAISNKLYKVYYHIIHKGLAFNLRGRSSSFAVEECHIAVIHVDLFQCSFRAFFAGGYCSPVVTA